MIDDFFVHDVTILRAATVTDGYGDSAHTWTGSTSKVTKGWLAQIQETEAGAFGASAGAGRALLAVTRDVLRLPIDTDITAYDRVVVDGITYEVDGKPRRVWTPRGAHHLKVNLRAVEG